MRDSCTRCWTDSLVSQKTWIASLFFFIKHNDDLLLHWIVSANRFRKEINAKTCRLHAICISLPYEMAILETMIESPTKMTLCSHAS